MPLRSTIVGAASGVVLLAGLVGFAVGLPEVVDDESQAADRGPAAGKPSADLLPDRLLGGALVTLDSVGPQYAPVAEEVRRYSSETLTDAFATDVAVGIYATPDLQAQVAVTIYDGESGLFLQAGPPVPPAMDSADETIGEVVRSGDAVCVAQWQVQDRADGRPPFQVQCQRVVGGRTVNVYATPGISVEQTTDIVDDVVDQAGLD